MNLRNNKIVETSKKTFRGVRNMNCVYMDIDKAIVEKSLDVRDEIEQI